MCTLHDLLKEKSALGYAFRYILQNNPSKNYVFIIIVGGGGVLKSNSIAATS